MTNTQIATIVKGIARAHRDGCYIIGKGTIKATGARCWSVQGKSNVYIVVQLDSHTLTCSCPSYAPCKHRNLVTTRIMEAAARDAKIEQLLDEILGPVGMDASEDEDRENAPMALKDNSRRFLRV